MSAHREINLPTNTPFRIAKKHPNGNLRDWTIYIVDKLGMVRIYFRSEGFFVNPPSDRMDTRIMRDIDTYGVEYVSEPEFNEIRKEFKHSPIGWLRYGALR